MSLLYMLFILYIHLIFFFFFKQKTAYEMRISDWSSDVCSSDLGLGHSAELLTQTGRLRRGDPQRHGGVFNIKLQQTGAPRSRAEHAGRAGDMPAPIIMIRVNHVADAA